MDKKKKDSKKLRLTTLNLIGILSLMFLVALALLIHFINEDNIPNDPDDKIRVEIIKGLLGVLVVTIIGGTVAALFKAHERDIEQTKVQTQIKLEFIKRIGELYRLTKKLRRKLKEEGIKISDKDSKLVITEKQYIFYANQMDLLNDVQLEIEGFKIAAENKYLFPDCIPIAKHLERMEVYLNKIHGEYEEQNPKIEISEKIDMNAFDFLKEFTVSSNAEYLIRELNLKYKLDKNVPEITAGKLDYCFKNVFSKSYGDLLKDLRW